MGNRPLADLVAQQYQTWQYPEPIIDLPNWLVTHWQWFDPSHAHRLFWPDRSYRPDMDILIAGCGTNQAAVFAYTNPKAHVVAIDVSPASIEHHRFLKDKYGMKNLDLHLLPVEEAGELGRTFDLVVSTGVLHHLYDPPEGAKALANCLRAEGVLALMIYARYGRIGVEMLQAAFRELGLGQNDASLLTVKEAIKILPQGHPLWSYLDLAPDLGFDAGVVDTFLHGRERTYTVGECLELVASSGLIFQDWFRKSAYYPPILSENEFHIAVAALPETQQWSIMEKFYSKNACHFFTACRPTRPPQAYRIDFSSTAFFDYVPAFRYQCGFKDGEVFRYDWRLPLNPVELALVEQVNASRTIREILVIVANSELFSKRSRPEREEAARIVFRSLWQQDFLEIHLEPGS